MFFDSEFKPLQVILKPDWDIIDGKTAENRIEAETECINIQEDRDILVKTDENRCSLTSLSLDVEYEVFLHNKHKVYRCRGRIKERYLNEQGALCLISVLTNPAAV